VDDIINEFLKYLAAFVVSILTVWIKQKIDDRKKRRGSEVQFTLEFDLRVKLAEHELMRAYGQSRTFVYNFSNGEFTDSGLPFVKISMWHEVVEGHYVPYMSPHYQPPRNCPAMFNDMFRDIFTNGFHYLEDREDIKPSNRPLYDYMKSWGITSLMMCALNDTAGKPRAVLVFHWPRKKYRIDEEILNIKKDIYKIENMYREIKR
jgi:hypothetical protein